MVLQLQKDMVLHLQKYMAHPLQKIAKELGSTITKRHDYDMSYNFAFSYQLPVGGLQHFCRLCPFFFFFYI